MPFMNWFLCILYCVAMLRNRSVPVDTVLPHLTYQNLEEALEWLARVFGFVEHYRYGEPMAGAQLHLGNAYIMISTLRAGRASPAITGGRTQSLTVFVEDVEGHFARSQDAGAILVEELHETIYGELQYGVEDPEGHHWLFSRHARDVGPEEWGAKIAGP